ncbi:MAG: PKD domain-containing protein [Chitinophagales bacterium]
MKNRFILLMAIFALTVVDAQAHEVLSGCDADFEIASQVLTASGWQVTFSNLSEADAGIGTVIWYFGDGTSSTAFEPSHIYSVAGEYEICLVITSADGACVDDNCDTWMIGEMGGECEANWDWEDDGLTVAFINDSDDGGSTIVTYLWSFGDGTTSSEENPDHTYTSAGEYEVCLSIITADGCYSTKCDDVDVEGGSGGGNCDAFFAVQSITAGDGVFTVEFDNQSSGGISGGPTPYVWSFGDGSAYFEGDEATHFYAAPGTYLVCLTMGVSGSDCFDQFCDEIVLGSADCIDTALMDPTVECTTVIDPVCGCDNITYDNACIAENYYGVIFWVSGECSTTGISETDKSTLHIYPNPANDFIVIENALPGIATIEIRNTTGALVWQLTDVFIEEAYTVSLNELHAGNYFMSIIQSNERKTKALIIQH